jgi:hypothetical protein
MPEHDCPFPIAKRVPLVDIDAAVCARLGPARVPGDAQPAAFSRQVAMYLAKHVGGWSTTKFGKFYHGRDHSTVCHSIRRVESIREQNPELDAFLSGLGHESGIKQRNLRTRPTRLALQRHRPCDPTNSFFDSLADRIVDRLLARIGGQADAGLAVQRPDVRF